MKNVILNLSSIAIHYWLGKSHFCRAPESHRIQGGDQSRARQEKVFYAVFKDFSNKCCLVWCPLNIIASI